MHNLLKRQLRKLGLSSEQLPSMEEWVVLLERIAQTYQDMDANRYTLERSLKISSDEMRGLYEEKLKNSERRFKQIFEETDFISVQGFNKHHKVTYWNPASETHFGYSEDEAMGQCIEDLIIPDVTRQNITQLIDDSFNYGHAIPSSEVELHKKDGSPIDVLSSYILINNDYNEVEMFCLDIDMTLRKQFEEKIIHQAHYDALTELPNRFLALDRLTQLFNEAERNDELVAVFFLDLDDFKKVNDTLGHEVGDKVLVETAHRLTSDLRMGDTIGRLGGDEFIVLLSGLSSVKDSQRIAENLLRQFRSPFIIDDREIVLGASIGIAIYPVDAKTPSEILRNADSAMFHAKRQGRNTYEYFTKDMNHDVSKRLTVEEQLYNALDNNEFEVYYQAKIELSTGKIMGAEALLRWDNPVLGKVSPDEFIPIAEQTGFIVPLGQYVLVEALKVTAYWHEKYDSTLHIAVNLSPRQFRNSGLVEFVEMIMQQTGVSSKYLELEVTEGMLMGGHQYIMDTLDSLEQRGITISMDDFGTGYSSLSYLQNYPFSVLKIDRSFINGMMDNAENRELVQAIIAMAHALKLQVVAEGVETREQRDHLKKWGCDYVQGYFFSKPVTADAMSALLKSSK